MIRGTLRYAHYLLPLLILAAAVALRWQQVPFVSQLQFNVFDTYQRAAPRDYRDVGVRIVDLDDRSLEALGQWPWPRTKVAKLVYQLRQAGARVVAFDIVFAEPDRTSPQRVVEDWPQVEGVEQIREQVADLPDHDSLFARFIGGLGGIVTAIQFTDGKVNRMPVQKGNFSVGGERGAALTDFIPTLPGAVANLKILGDAAAGNGLINVLPERDGVVRRVPLMLALDRDQAMLGRPVYPTLSVEALRVLQGGGRTMPVKLAGASGELRWSAASGVSKLRVGSITVPTDAQGRMWAHFTGHQKDRYVSAVDVMNGTFDKGKIADHIVLIGTSAAGLLDLRSTPLDPVLPGVEVHAELLEQMLLGHFLDRPYWAADLEMLFLLLLAILLIVATPRIGALWPAVVGGGAIALAFGASWWAYTEWRLLFDPVYAGMTLVAIYLSSSLIGFVRTEGERRQVRAAFSTYLSPALVEQLADNPDRLKLGGETRNMTFLFCDVRGFTTISEAFKDDPQGLTRLINRFLTPLTDRILERKGTIDKYMGDCIMAFWNAPVDVADHAVQSCDAALAMMRSLDDLNAERKARAEAAGEEFLPLNIGIGLNTGDCVVGNMGSDQRFDYSVLGDAVNLASRLEGQSKSYGVGIVIGPETALAAADRFAVLELDLIAVKGKSEAVAIHTLLGDTDLRASAAFQKLAASHAAMIAAYRARDWDGAEAALAICEGQLGGAMDAFYAVYRARIAEFKADPPGPDWDGVYVATSK